MKIWLGNSIRLPLQPRLAIIQAIPLAMVNALTRRQNSQLVRPSSTNPKRKSFARS